MSKKVVNRYTLVEETEQIEERINGSLYLTNLFNRIDKYNKYTKNPYFLGRVEIIKLLGLVKYIKFKKLSEPSTLEKIDRLTSSYNEKDIRELYKDKLTQNKPIFIAYKSNRKLRTLEIIYKKDKKYIDRNYIKEHIMDYASNINFINLLLENKQIRKSVHKSAEEYNLLYNLRESLRISDNPNLDIMRDFYNAFINERGKFNYFNMRLLGMLLKAYDETLEPIIIEHEEEISGQIMLEEFNRQILRDKYESLKEELMENAYIPQEEKSLTLDYKTTK